MEEKKGKTSFMDLLKHKKVVIGNGEEIEKLINQIENLKKDLEKSQEAEKSSQDAKAALDIKYEELKKEYEHIEDKLDTFESNRLNKSQENNEFQENIKDYEIKMKNIELENEKLSKTVTDMEDTIKKINQEKNKYKNELNQLKESYKANKIKGNKVDLFTRGKELYKNGEYFKAVGYFRAALIHNEDDIKIINNIGVCYSMLGFDNYAIEEFERILKLDPQHERAKKNLQILMSKKED